MSKWILWLSKLGPAWAIFAVMSKYVVHTLYLSARDVS